MIPYAYRYAGPRVNLSANEKRSMRHAAKSGKTRAELTAPPPSWVVRRGDDVYVITAVPY